MDCFESEGEELDLNYHKCPHYCDVNNAESFPCEDLQKEEGLEGCLEQFSEAGESECGEEICGCSCKQNRFLLSFQDTAHLEDTCLNESRVKCRAFWDYIDANPGYGALIREGHFSALNPQIPRYAACYGIETQRGQNSCQNKAPQDARRSKREDTTCSRVLPIEIKFRSDAERQRFQKRRNEIVELQSKSGQPIIRAKKDELPNCFRNVYADEVKEIDPFQGLKC